MPINLKLIPAPATLPRRPKWWIWLLLLLAGLVGGTAYAILNNGTKAEVNTETFWSTALLIPALFWLTLLLLRLIWHNGQQSMAYHWDKDRELALLRETQRGRRSLQVLGASLHSALRKLDDTKGEMQWSALQAKAQALKTQASWLSDEGLRHSRLVRHESETPEQLLSRVLSETLDDISQLLASVPADMPLAVLVESNTSVPHEQLQAIWQQSWAVSPIRQSVTHMTGSGLTVIDQWLDQDINKLSLLLVVALQVAPEQPKGTAEAVVGLLFGSAQTTTDLAPVAILHRPEQAHQTSVQDLHYALHQSLDWAPVAAEQVTCGWLVGVETVWHEAIATGLKALPSPINIGQDLQDLDKTLGYPGPAAPWLAIAAAADGSSGGEPQLIVSGDGSINTPLWATVVMPAS
ncbi:hypothetical protein [Rouxiella sp. Mn2063]|uniref:hypothetical protein n=1 Tax=Rouxiella sp. Mn2063 TaxID=3395262 RepID=UPI003BE5651E